MKAHQQVRRTLAVGEAAREGTSSGPPLRSNSAVLYGTRLLRIAVALVLASILASSRTHADYLVASRQANLKTEPSSAGQTLAHLAEGDVIQLLESEQTNGYYHASNASGSGWVYRTFVRRHLGDPPSDTTGGTVVHGTSLSSAGLWDPIGADSRLMRLHVINVGQANSALLEFPCGAVLIDAGAENQALVDTLVQYLDAFFARRTDLHRTIDTILITHNHVDHTRALREVAEHFQVNNFIENGQRGGQPEGDKDVDWLKTNATARHVHYRDVDDSDVTAIRDRTGFTTPDIDPVSCKNVDPDIRVLSADFAELDRPNWSEADFQNKNNHSIVIRVTFGQSKFLFTGDLEEPAIETLVDYYRGTNALDADVYHVGHHGSRNGTTQSLMDATTPDIALISMGPWDRQANWTAWAYGHPRLEAVELLERGVRRRRESPPAVHVATAQHAFTTQTMTAAVYGTGWDGTVIVVADTSGNLRVGSPEHP